MNYKEQRNNTEFLDFQEDILKECVNSDFIHFDFEIRKFRNILMKYVISLKMFIYLRKSLIFPWKFLFILF